MEDEAPVTVSVKKIIALILVVVIVISAIWVVNILFTSSDPPWIFSHPEVTVNKSSTNNITTETIIAMNDWAENYHDKYHIDSMYITITTAVENDETYLFSISIDFIPDLNVYTSENGGAGPITDGLISVFSGNSITLSDDSIISEITKNRDWKITDNDQVYYIEEVSGVLEVHLPGTEYGEYYYHDKLSTIIENDACPVGYFDVDGDSYLSVGDYFISDVSKITEEFDYFGFYYKLKFGDHWESIIKNEGG